MKPFLTGAGTIFALEMRQRLRGVAWYVLLGVFFGLLLVVTIVMSVIIYSTGQDAQTQRQLGAPVYSLIIYFVLLLGTLVAPAMSGNAINGDRDAGTLATTQVTLVTTWQIVVGKFVAAWVTALGFLAVSVPFLLFAAFAGGLQAATILVSLLVLAVELGVVAAIGVGLSGLIPRPLFSVVVTYLAVAALGIGTLIAFSLGGLVTQSPTTDYYWDNVHVKTQTCTGLESNKSTVPRFDHVWGILAVNPYVVLADAVPTTFDKFGQPNDLFGQIKFGERSVQISPLANNTPATACKQALVDYSGPSNSPSARRVFATTTPGWAVGLGIQLVLAALALWGAWMRTRTPAGRLPKGSRVA
jgi:ABC-type transport system involved in multi-copper enzyme maturation permease subunit